MLILTVVLVSFGGWLVTGWVVDELAESRREITPTKRAMRASKRQPSHRRPPRLADLLVGWRELAHAHALLRGDLP